VPKVEESLRSTVFETGNLGIEFIFLYIFSSRKAARRRYAYAKLERGRQRRKEKI